jgi:hypothetical protein
VGGSLSNICLDSLLGYSAQSWIIKDVLDCDLESVLAQSADKLDGSYGIAANAQETIVATDRFSRDVEQFSPDVLETGFCGVNRASLLSIKEGEVV